MMWHLITHLEGVKELKKYIYTQSCAMIVPHHRIW